MSVTLDTSTEGLITIPEPQTDFWRVTNSNTELVIGRTYSRLRARELVEMLHQTGINWKRDQNELVADSRVQREVELALLELHRAIDSDEPAILARRSMYEHAPNLWAIRCCTLACGDDTPQKLLDEHGFLIQCADREDLIDTASDTGWVRVNDQQHWMCLDCADLYCVDSSSPRNRLATVTTRIRVKPQLWWQDETQWTQGLENLTSVKQFLTAHCMATEKFMGRIEFRSDGKVSFDSLMSDPVIIMCHPNGDPVVEQYTVPQQCDFPVEVADGGIVYVPINDSDISTV